MISIHVPLALFDAHSLEFSSYPERGFQNWTSVYYTTSQRLTSIIRSQNGCGDSKAPKSFTGMDYLMVWASTVDFGYLTSMSLINDCCSTCKYSSLRKEALLRRLE